VILTPPLSESTELVRQLLEQQAKVVRIVSGAQPPDELCPTIFVDDEQAGQAITEHLLAQGHKRIAFLGYHKDHKSSLGRYRGYCAALKNAGLEVQDELVISGNFTFDSGVQMTEQLLQLHSKATALFGCNDEIAAGALFVARKRDLRVPQDLSIVGFENSPFSRQTWPGLTTVHQPNAEIAAKAASMLIALMLEPEQAPLDCGFKLQLVLRDSVAPI
jgi:LacI family transcriptional regulator